VQAQRGAKHYEQNDRRHHQDRCIFPTADWCPKEKCMENSIQHAMNPNTCGVVVKMSKLEIHFVEGGFSTSRGGR
jgi:hypothetical protein